MPAVTSNEYLVACFLRAVIIKPSHYNIAYIAIWVRNAPAIINLAHVNKKQTETSVILPLYLSHLLRTQHTPLGGLTVICILCNCINCTNVTQIILAYFRTTAIGKLHCTALLPIRRRDTDTCTGNWVTVVIICAVRHGCLAIDGTELLI